MRPWLVLVNPRAARGRGSMVRVKAILHSKRIPADVLELDGLPSLHDAVRTAAADGRDHFVSVGGDGTVNAVVNTVLQHEWEKPPVLGVLPTGTGCDLIRTFGIGRNLDQAAERLTGPTTYPIDVGIAIGEWGRRYFLNVASAGVTGAAAVAAMRLPGWLGTFRYVGGMVGALPRFRMAHVELEAGRRRYSGGCLTVVFANGQFFGGGFNIAPRASMVDGELDVQVIKVRRREVGRLMRKVRRGDHLTDPAVHRYVVDEARLETNDPWPVEVDGEPIGTTPLLVRLQAGRIMLKI